jgi:hypothetical protein
MAARIMLVLSDRQWTLMAIHLASAMARSRRGEVILLKLVAVRHPVLLADDAGYLDYTSEDRQAVWEFEKTAAAYGVPYSTVVCRYASYVHAVVDAAEQLGAEAVFAPHAASRLPIWSAVQHWWLRHSLTRHGRALYTLEHTGDTPDWSPAITLTVGGSSLPE